MKLEAWAVGITAGSRDVPGRKDLWQETFISNINNNNNNNNNSNFAKYVFIPTVFSVRSMRCTFICYSKLYWHVSAFSPAIVSTPYTHIHTSSVPQQNLSLTTTEPTVSMGSMQYSHRHNGLYLYVGRLVRPVWNLRIVARATVDKVQFVSIGDVNYLVLILILSLCFVGPELIFLLECGRLLIGINFVTSI